MAHSHISSFAASAALSLNFIPVSEKLCKNNHQMWRAQVFLALRGAQLAGYISPTTQPTPSFLPPPKGDDKKNTPPTPNPDFEVWMAEDQQVLNYLLSSLSAASSSSLRLRRQWRWHGLPLKECRH